uniref:Uncharacterized protein n=1 Tax=Oryza barthii TaxID=65489 RepID=A0A0D3FJ51_9ORYZ
MDSSTDHAPFIRFAYLDSTTVLPKGLDSEVLQRTSRHYHNSSILRFNGSSDQYRLIVARARKIKCFLSQSITY